MDAKEEVRARLNIEDVIGEYVVLKRAGRNFKGLSPFSGEKTPSFVVSPEKQIWHDFSSGKGGDVFSFIMEVEGLTFREALENLARKAGVELAAYENKNAKEMARQKQRLYEINEASAHFFQYHLVKNHEALEYVFKKRGFSREVATEFRIGYAPNSQNGLVNYLSKKGYSRNELKLAGVVNRFGGDLFKDRVMIPLMDSTGRVIGFTGRILKDDPKAPKYLNTPQTLLYDKSRHVFGLSQAKDSIRKSDFAVVVEGNLDVVSAHQAGTREVVATAGTAMTEQHLKALNRFSGNIKLSFDSDKAGLAATERAIDISDKVGVEITIISLPEGFKDPDELIQHDKNMWIDAIDRSEPVIDWVLGQYAKQHDVTTVQGKRDFTSAGLKLVKKITDSVVREHYMKFLSEKTGASFDALNQKLETLDNPQRLEPKKAIKSNVKDFKVDQDRKSEQRVLAALIMSIPSRKMLEGMKQDTFSIAEHQKLAEYLRDNQNDNFDTIPEKLQEIDTCVKIIQTAADEIYREMSEQDRQKEAEILLRQMVIKQKERKKENLQMELKEAEAAGDEEITLKLLGQINQITKEINYAKR